VLLAAPLSDVLRVKGCLEETTQNNYESAAGLTELICCDSPLRLPFALKLT
jgi:hypothetical protein